MNTTFHATGVWNERGWSLAYVKSLRKALDAAGLQATQIIANDGTDNSNCRDCPGGAWGQASVSNAIGKDAEFAAALGMVGMHHGNTEGERRWSGANRVCGCMCGWVVRGMEKKKRSVVPISLLCSL